MAISLSYLSLFGVKKTNTFIRSRGSLENHTQFQTIMVKIYTHFQTIKRLRTIPFGAAHTYIADIGSTPLGSRLHIWKWIIRFRDLLQVLFVLSAIFNAHVQVAVNANEE